MEEAEKMEALKKAYADIILNTAKESAARIMESERKALCFQQDLCSVKDEALRMLVRMKQMLDSKITEAEITSLNQQRRIQELEAQLQEAEGTITDLRIELKKVQEEFEKAKNNQMQPLKQQSERENSPSHGSTRNENSLNACRPLLLSPSDIGAEVLTSSALRNATLLNDKFCIPTSDSRLEEDTSNNTPDISSIIMRSKEPELYRNGFTQRIRAFGDVNNQNSAMKNESIIRSNEKGEGTFPALSPKDQSNNLDSNCEDQPAKVINRLHRRKTPHGKGSVTSQKSHPILLKNDSINSKIQSYKVDGDVEYAESLETQKIYIDDEEKVPHSSRCYKDQTVQKFLKGCRKRKMHRRNAVVTSGWSPPDQLNKLSQSSSFLSRCKTSTSDKNNAKSGEDKIKLLSHLASEMSSVIPDYEENTLHTEEENFSIAGSKLNAEMIDVPITDSDPKDADASEATNACSTKADKDRLLKYTFQRKRKKEPLSSPDVNTSLEKNSNKRRAGEKQLSDAEPTKPSLINESTRDSRRLAQVARQLISLSGKRW